MWNLCGTYVEPVWNLLCYSYVSTVILHLMPGCNAHSVARVSSAVARPFPPRRRFMRSDRAAAVVRGAAAEPSLDPAPHGCSAAPCSSFYAPRARLRPKRCLARWHRTALQSSAVIPTSDNCFDHTVVTTVLTSDVVFNRVLSFNFSLMPFTRASDGALTAALPASRRRTAPPPSRPCGGTCRALLLALSAPSSCRLVPLHATPALRFAALRCAALCRAVPRLLLSRARRQARRRTPPHAGTRRRTAEDSAGDLRIGFGSQVRCSILRMCGRRGTPAPRSRCRGLCPSTAPWWSMCCGRWWQGSTPST